MRPWIFPFCSFLVAMAMAFAHLNHEQNDGAAEDPMRWASDEWTTWEVLPISQVDSNTWSGLTLPQVEKVRRFSTETGLEVWHSDMEWPQCPIGWVQQPWKGGWICGSSESLSKWVDQPNEMARHWRNTEGFGRLVKQECGWVFFDQGCVLWLDEQSPECGSQHERPEDLWIPVGQGSPSHWWTAHPGLVPSEWVVDECCLRLQAHGIPVTGWGTRWAGGARLIVDGGRRWEDEIQAIAQQQGWSVTWSGDELIINGSEAWNWVAVEGDLAAAIDDELWRGNRLQSDVVAWIPMKDETPSSEEIEFADLPKESASIQTILGQCRNHVTGGRMNIVTRGDSLLLALQEDGTEVWARDIVGDLLPGGAKEVDLYSNGKYQTMYCDVSSLHAIDVNGREVNGFPLSLEQGQCSAWALVDYDNDRKYRFLLADEKSGLIQNFRRRGERTLGWLHEPSEKVDQFSPIRHMAHLRLGSKDYIYVGRNNGQVELLKRTGSTRASTDVRVHPAHPRVPNWCRFGSNLCFVH